MKAKIENLQKQLNEHLSWTARNCDRCWKHSRPKGNDEYTAFVCTIDADIQGQMAGLAEIRQRSYDITQKADCPFRQEKRPAYKRERKVYKQQLALEL